MNRSFRIQQTPDRRGATMVTVVLLLPVLFVLSAMAINFAYIQLINTRVQIVADASARAAGATFVQTGSETNALTAAQEIAALNPVDGTVIPILEGDLEFGLSERTALNRAYTFTAAANGNAVRLSTSAFHTGTGTALQPYFPGFSPALNIRPLCTATHSQTTLDITLIVDRSGSMKFAADEPSGGTPAAAPEGWKNGDPVPPNSRWLDLVAAVHSFCDELDQTAKREKVGLVSYANDAHIDENLTEDYSKVHTENDQVTNSFQGGMTNVGDGIVKGIEAVTSPSHCRPWATNALVLMSDGIHNTGTDPIEAASLAVAEGIPIYTVSFSNEADQALMQQIADMTGGTHYHAVDAVQLNAAFREIARRLPSMLTQ